MFKNSIKALVLGTFVLSSLSAIEMTNKWIRKPLALVLYKNGDLKAFDFDKNNDTKTIPGDSTNIQAIYIIATDVKQIGKGVRWDWYKCISSQDLVKYVITGHNLDAKKIIMNSFKTSLNPKPDDVQFVF